MIEDFIARYTKEYDFYSQGGRLAAQILEANLEAAGVRSIVTSRAKSIVRLQEKCRQREQKRGGYRSVNDIFEDIVDLAGVRVALYFPAERDQVDGMITRLFHLVDPKKEFPDPEKTRQDKRFSGYSAVHYRIQLKEQDLSEPERRYAAARIEVQVASVLMHAWAEVEHDLVYKPLAGELSEEEYAILDQLNGLVMAGEISLERLQKSGESRVAVTDRKIANHYDLAAHLLGRAEATTGRPISDSGLGRVDLLFDLLVELKIDTPGQLAPYIDALDGNVELRPLAEQIIDALLAEDDSRYAVYSTIRARQRSAFFGVDPENEDIYRQVGLFMTRWIELEVLIRQLASRNGIDRPIPVNARLLKGILPLDGDILAEYDRLRRMRNNVVHGIETPPAADLAEAARRLAVITAEINRRDDGPDPAA